MNIDHLLSFPTEAAALEALTGTRFVADGAFDASRCFPGLTLVISPATYDAEGEQLSPQVNFPGWWVVISTEGEGPDGDLAALEACRLVADRARATRGEPFVFQQGLRALPEQIAQITRIDGLPAGSAYPFDALSVIE